MAVIDTVWHSVRVTVAAFVGLLLTLPLIADSNVALESITQSALAGPGAYVLITGLLAVEGAHNKARCRLLLWGLFIFVGWILSAASVMGMSAVAVYQLVCLSPRVAEEIVDGLETVVDLDMCPGKGAAEAWRVWAAVLGTLISFSATNLLLAATLRARAALQEERDEYQGYVQKSALNTAGLASAYAGESELPASYGNGWGSSSSSLAGHSIPSERL
eukprot:CAMPEP_0182580188 /NCGR_PEP_ID=MMETSP1324-20130603/46241_1 /TAXON_ID=236786 /ORGANISM="Florenciella sp., Strain RCC1587" /LENGTH=217 /DNA_ID=CAMNT_0024796379 /DNA_START=4 /DNA_END=657 /DNA_ORIENTATION=+